jgi:LAO/AO transport system kinase
MSRNLGDTTLASLLADARDGQPRAVGRLISLVENQAAELPLIMRELAPATGRAQVIGLTGPPGVGKSTTITGLLAALRQRGDRVGVLAVDPSSPFSGGALLGDRVRMQQHALDPEVFIRSMATRGHLGGLAAATSQALRVFDAADCDTVLVETVGVGQSEVEVSRIADCTVVLLAPGAGDGIQAAKAGILEIGDVFVVNKSDREGAHAVVRDLRTMIALDAARADGEWRPPIVSLVATTGEGISDLVAALDRFRTEAEASGRWPARRLLRARQEVETLALAELRRELSLDGGTELETLATAVRDGLLDPFTAAARLLESLDGSPPTPRRSAWRRWNC